jgi:ABC-type methionine transport system permease subunit
MSGSRLLLGGRWGRGRLLRWVMGGLAAIAILVWSAQGVNLNLREFIRGLPWVVDLVSRMVPPNWEFLPRLGRPVLETIQIALWGTLLSMALALPLGLLAARNLCPNLTLYHLTRQALNLLRGINEFVFALIFVAAVGLGPFAGVLSLAIHGAGLLGKFYADAIEEIDAGPVEALRATGVSSSVLKSNPTSALVAVAGLKAQVTAQEVKVGAMRGYLAETAPDFKQAMNELASLRAQLAKQEKDQPAATGQGDYVAKFREFKYQETLFELFAKQFEMAKVDESREGAVIQVLDAAQPPEKKSKPKKALIAIIATLAAGFALLLFVFIRQAMRNAKQDPESAQKLTALQASWRKALGRG